MIPIPFSFSKERKSGRVVLVILWSEHEKSVLDEIKLQSEVVTSCVSLAEEIFRMVLAGCGDVWKKIEEFAALRNEAARIKMRVLLKLSDWSSNLVDRDDLVHLAGKIDAIAGCVNSAVNNLTVLSWEVVWKILGGEEFSAMIRDAFKCARMLNEAVAGFANGVGALSMIDEINRMEHVVDEEHLKLRMKLQGGEFVDVPMPLAIGVSSVIDGLEGVADRSEDAAEVLRVILTKLR